MVAINENFAPANPALGPKNRVGNFFGEEAKSNRGNRLPAQQPRREKAHRYDETASGMLFYGYRYYSPELGRWLSRDPIEEQGGLNLYATVGNNLINLFDFLGLTQFVEAAHKKVAVTGKSYIAPITNLGRLPQGFNQAILAQFARLIDLRENPTTDAMDKQYRLFAQRVFSFCAAGGKIYGLQAEDLRTDSGKEGPFQAPDLRVSGSSYTLSSDKSRIDFRWTVSGTPHIAVEPGFQLVFPRRTRAISHSVSGKITVSGTEPKVEMSISGTVFPSHRAFYNLNPDGVVSGGVIAETLPQGPLSALWNLP